MRKAAEPSFTVFETVKHSPHSLNMTNLRGLRYPPLYKDMDVNSGEVATSPRSSEPNDNSYGFGLLIGILVLLGHMAAFAMLLCRYRRHRDRVRNDVIEGSAERTNFVVEEVKVLNCRPLPAAVNNAPVTEGLCSRFATALKNMFCGCCGCCDPPIPPLQPMVLCPDDERPIPRSPNMLIPRDPCTEPPQRCTIAPNGNLGV